MQTIKSNPTDNSKLSAAVNLRPFAIESASPLQLPPVCACCGITANCSVSIKPSDPAKIGKNLFIEGLGAFFHPLGLYTHIKTLQSPAVKIPMCKNCWFKHFFPSRKTFIFVALHILFLILAFYHGFQNQFNYMLLDLFLAIVCLVVVVRKNVRHDSITLPVKVSLHDEKFRYTIYGGPLYNLFGKQKQPSTKVK